MKRAFFTTFLLLSFVFVPQAQTFYGTTDIKNFREGRDKEFRNRKESPLLEEDFLNFKGLEYFPTDEKFSVKAKLEKTADARSFMMPTSVGKSAKFIKYGVLKFELDGKTHSLSIYQSEALLKTKEFKDLLFIPFRDLTNGKETYGGGRYLDIKIPSGSSSGGVILNFNLAYNPNCAYGSDKYACPVPPMANFLQVKIMAGEKKFVSLSEKILK